MRTNSWRCGMQAFAAEGLIPTGPTIIPKGMENLRLPITQSIAKFDETLTGDWIAAGAMGLTAC